MPVASSASAMPGATTTRLVFCWCGDFDKGVHDPEDRAEQADERRGGAGGRQHRQPLLQAFGFLGDGHIHAAIDPGLAPGIRPPSSRWDRRHSVMPAANIFSAGPPGSDPIVSKRPSSGSPDQKRLIEPLGLCAGAAILQDFLHDNRPRPERSDNQDDHYKFYGKCRAEE